MDIQRAKKFILILAGSCAIPFITSCTTPDGNAEDGARWFKMHNCSSCHGENADNGRAAAIAGIRMGFSSFENYLRDPDSPSMPKFSEEKLTNKDAADIYAWLKSLPSQ